MKSRTEQDAIRNLQRYLRQLSYIDESIPSPPVDGIFEQATEDSLRAFQRKFGLPASGVADKETWDMLYAEYLASIAFHESPALLYLFPRTPDSYEVILGDEFFLVSVIQFLLNELRIVYDSFLPIVISGIFDEATEANIIAFQRVHALPQTGRVDKATWNRLVRSYNDYAYDYVR